MALLVKEACSRAKPSNNQQITTTLYEIMIILATLPVMFSSLLIAAHFYRSGSLLLTAVGLAFPLLLLFRNQWTPRLVTIFLLLSAAEWLRTMLLFVERYQQSGLPATRLVIILGGVSLFTALSALVFLTKGMKKRFRIATKNDRYSL